MAKYWFIFIVFLFIFINFGNIDAKLKYSKDKEIEKWMKSSWGKKKSKKEIVKKIKQKWFNKRFCKKDGSKFLKYYFKFWNTSKFDINEDEKINTMDVMILVYERDSLCG
jgi:hypothetical protein